MYLEDLRSQLAADLGVKVSHKLIWATLRRNGLSLKKVNKTTALLTIDNDKRQASQVAAERSAFKRAEYVLRISDRYTKDQLVFADETSFDRRTAHRKYAWAVKGQRASKKVLLTRGKRFVTCKLSFEHLWIRQLSMTMTDLGCGHGFISSRRPRMNSLKRSVS